MLHHRRGAAAICVALFLLMTLTSPTTYAQSSSRALFVDAPTPRGTLTQQTGVIRSRAVTLNQDALSLAAASVAMGRTLDDPGIALNLFPDVTWVATNTGLQQRAAGRPGYVWTGTIPSVAHSDVMLVVSDGMVSGRVMTPQGTYLIEPRQDGLHIISQVNPSIGGNDLPTDALDYDTQNPMAIRNTEAPSLFPDDGSTIDVLILYTPASIEVFGGIAETELAIENMITLTNATYENSGINHRVRLVQMERVEYTERPQSVANDLNALSNLGDGFIDHIHASRDLYGADLVSLVTGTPEDSRNYCGVAWLLTGYPTGGFSVLEAACAGTVVMPHEFGHNLGATHDVNNGGSGGGYYVYAVGYQDQAESIDDYGDFVTVMAYNRNGECPIVNPIADVGEAPICPHIPYWSNPAATYQGKPLGNDQTDNVKALGNTALLVSNFRDSTAPLLVNGDFEQRDETGAPVGWKVKKAGVKDSVRTDKPDKGKFHSYTGERAFRLKGQGEFKKTRLNQKLDPATLNLSEGDTLTLTAWVSGKNLQDGVRVSLRVKYEDESLETTRINLFAPTGTYDYTELSDSVVLNGTPNLVKVQVRYKSREARGRAMIDTVILNVERLSNSGIPLPNTP